MNKFVDNVPFPIIIMGNDTFHLNKEVSDIITDSFPNRPITYSFDYTKVDKRELSKYVDNITCFIVKGVDEFIGGFREYFTRGTCLIVVCDDAEKKMVYYKLGASVVMTTKEFEDAENIYNVLLSIIWSRDYAYHRKTKTPKYYYYSENIWGDVVNCDIYFNGNRYKMQDNTFRILSMLLEHHGEIVSRRHIMYMLWGKVTRRYKKRLTVLLAYLRRVLNETDMVTMTTFPRRGLKMDIMGVDDTSTLQNIDIN